MIRIPEVTYDEIGNLKTRLDSKNQKTEYVYDDSGKLQTVKYYNPVDPVNPVKNILFSFDKIGHLKSYNDGTTQGQYQYDALYRKTNETVNYGPFSKSFQYDYYKNSLKKTYTDPSGINYTYSYDSNNQLASIQIPDQGNITYQSYNWLAPTQITLPGGTKKEYEYDPLMRIKKITSFDPGQNVLLNFQYSYDKMDNIRAKTTEHGNYSYNYDDLYRLTDDRRPATAESYKYDEVGNRTSSVSGVTVNWTYNQNNELQNYNGVTFQYDLNGNVIQKTTDNGQLVTVDYKYDIENRLIRVEDGTGKVIAKYEYNPFGRRLWKEVDGQRTYFIYCNEGLAGEFDQNGSLTKAYGYKPNSTWTTDPVFMREGESYYYYHNDHLGTPQKMTLQNGSVVWQAKYTAFGEAEIDPNSQITNNLRAPGQYFDEETTFNYNYHRYYDPRSGRYITPDPIGLKSGVNLFAYVGANPINGIDPRGLFKYWGNWCGGNWTGGLKEEYNPAHRWSYREPITDDGGIDSCCKVHDIAYYECRQSRPCDKKERGQCMKNADRALAKCTSAATPYHHVEPLYIWMEYNPGLSPKGNNSKDCPCPDPKPKPYDPFNFDDLKSGGPSDII